MEKVNEKMKENFLFKELLNDFGDDVTEADLVKIRDYSLDTFNQSFFTKLGLYLPAILLVFEVFNQIVLQGNETNTIIIGVACIFVLLILYIDLRNTTKTKNNFEIFKQYFLAKKQIKSKE
jgi:hypothetical protein